MTNKIIFVEMVLLLNKNYNLMPDNSLSNFSGEYLKPTDY